MNEIELARAICDSGMRHLDDEDKAELLNRINKLNYGGEYNPLIKQLKNSKDRGDFWGRILEINFAYHFLKSGVSLKYEAKQGQNGNIDFCWVNETQHIFFELKLLGQDKKSRETIDQQLKSGNFFGVQKSHDLGDIGRIQRDIIQKSSTKKFLSSPKHSWVNIVVIEVSELQLGTIDITDLELAIGGNGAIQIPNLSYLTREEVVGIFEKVNRPMSLKEQRWMNTYDHPQHSSSSHPIRYIHGILFLQKFRENLATLSYDLKGKIFWNFGLINETIAQKVQARFHKIIPFSSFS